MYTQRNLFQRETPRRRAAVPVPGNREQKSSTKVEPAPPSPTFSAPGRYPDYFLANEDFLSTKSSQTMDYDMESKVPRKTHRFGGCYCIVLMFLVAAEGRKQRVWRHRRDQANMGRYFMSMCLFFLFRSSSCRRCGRATSGLQRLGWAYFHEAPISPSADNCCSASAYVTPRAF